MTTRTDQKKGECEIREHNEERQLTLHYGNMWFCDECWQLENKLSAENQSVEKQQERVMKVNNVVLMAKKVDSQVELREDIYNAETTAIVDIQKAIQADEKIVNKVFTLAEVITLRKSEFSKLIFDKQQEVAELRMRERAAQSILNSLSNQLHKEELEALKLKDSSYQPKAPKVIKMREPKVSTKSFKITEVKALAEKYGISVASIRSLSVVRSITAEAAAKLIAGE